MNLITKSEVKGNLKMKLSKFIKGLYGHIKCKTIFERWWHMGNNH